MKTFLCFLLIFLSGVGAGYTWRMSQELNTPIRYIYPTLSSLPKEIQKQFKKIQAKYGFENTLVRFSDPAGEYFIDESGRRISIKGES